MLIGWFSFFIQQKKLLSAEMQRGSFYIDKYIILSSTIPYVRYTSD